MCQDMILCLELVGKDLCEAHAAHSMLTDLMRREDRLADFDRSETRFGLWFIARSLALTMALAVQRTLQGKLDGKAKAAKSKNKRDDKASLARLLAVPQSADLGEDLSGLQERLRELRNGEGARKLQECRNGFMAHTLVGELGSRGGLKSDLIGDLLYEMTDLYENIHRAATGTEDRVISGALEKWPVRAQQTWDALLGIEEPEERELA